MKTKLLFANILLLLSLYGNAQWTQKANFGGTARAGAVGFSIGTKGYIGTGTEGNGSGGPNKNDFWEWDQSTDVWTQKANFSGTARSYAVGFSIGTKGYIGTGYDGTSKRNDFWQWDQSNNTWTQKANFAGTARYCAVGFSINAKGYIGTGYDDNSGTQNDFWEWDQASDTWIQKANVGGSVRGEAVGFSIGSKGYIGTGNDSTSILIKDFWEWDQTNDTWAQKANFGGTARRNAIGFNIGSKGYIGTGMDGSNKKDLWEWDPSTNAWSQKANLGGATRSQAIGFSIGTKGYIGTGGGGVNQLQDFWEFNSAIIGINEVDFDNLISVYPNPSSGKFIFKSEITKGEISIYNISGEKICSSVVNSKSSIINLDVPNGIYFLQFKTGEGVAVRNIIIHK